MVAPMNKSTLTRASRELFRRSPDERFESLSGLHQHCQRQREDSAERWIAPDALLPRVVDGRLDLEIGEAGTFRLTDWSFGQLCKLGGVSKDTLNKLSAETAGRALIETYAVHFDPALRDEIVRRVASLNMPSYTGFVQPKLEAVHDARGVIADVRISYPCDLETQMLEWSATVS